jgi:outer membrane receptor protein involved in Fe transport
MREFNFDNFDITTQQWINNPMFTSTLNFRRDVHAGYFTWAGKIKQLQLMAGLRGEYTFREIDHEKVDKPYTLNRFDLFPTGHLSLQATKSTQLMASYSRRINRPSGGDLDPFPNYMNQYTIRIGNPELKPEYTSSYQASVMQRFGTSFHFGRIILSLHQQPDQQNSGTQGWYCLYDQYQCEPGLFDGYRSDG